MIYPDFDDPLRQAMRREVELLFDTIVREDRSITELLTADYTFVNERLAALRHPECLRQPVPAYHARPPTSPSGLLGKGAFLTTSSKPERTSPGDARQVGHGEHARHEPPIRRRTCRRCPPRAADARERAEPTMRQKMRTTGCVPTARQCHVLMDPIGFALEPFDGIGLLAASRRDSRSTPPATFDNTKVDGPVELREWLAASTGPVRDRGHREADDYALGRGLEPRHAARAQAIARDCRERGSRFSALVLGIVNSAVPHEYEGPGWRHPVGSTGTGSAEPKSRTGGEADHVHHEEAHPPADVPAGRRCNAGAAAARCHGSGEHPLGADRGRTQEPLRRHLLSRTAAPGYWEPEGTRSRRSCRTSWSRSKNSRTDGGDEGLWSQSAEPPEGTTGSDHWVAAAFLTAIKPKKTAGSDATVGSPTIDQRIARRSVRTRCCRRCSSACEDPNSSSSNCGEGYSCAYTNSISWVGLPTPHDEPCMRTSPLPMELNPQVVFERLFGSGATPEFARSG
jgi:hypothetical protein